MRTLSMVHRRVPAVVVLALVFLVSCASPPQHVPVSQRPGPLPELLAGFVPGGRFEVSRQSGEIESRSGCQVVYEVVEPVGPDLGAAATVILAHGFMRDLASMQGWAVHWATHGVRTVAVSFCNSSWLSGRHDQNALDMIDIADLVMCNDPPTAPVIYAGFSAGGLSALLAAASDPRARAYLGLDAVDSRELSDRAIALQVPALFIFGEPSSCNANGNMTPIVDRLSNAIGIRVPFSTHCDFEDPYDPRCERICGSIMPVETADTVRETIRAVATAWVVDLALNAGAGWMGAGPQIIADLERAARVVPLEPVPPVPTQ